MILTPRPATDIQFRSGQKMTMYLTEDEVVAMMGSDEQWVGGRGMSRARQLQTPYRERRLYG